MTDLITGLFLIVGAAFMLVAALGVWRMPDLLTRMHATTKAGVLGAGLMLVGVGVHFGEVGVIVRVVAIIGFIMLTAPVAAHMIGRAGYFMGVPLWGGTVKDELKGRYDEETHNLASPSSAEQGDKGDTPGMEGGEKEET